MALQAFQVQELNSNSLSMQTRPKLVINEPFMNRSETAFSKKVTRREVLRDQRQLRKRKHVKVRPDKRNGKIIGKRRRWAGGTPIR